MDIKLIWDIFVIMLVLICSVIITFAIIDIEFVKVHIYLILRVTSAVAFVSFIGGFIIMWILKA